MIAALTAQAGGAQVVIAGAGPAGCAAAIRLARAGRQVVLADPVIDRPAAVKIGETLPSVAHTALADLGVDVRTLELAGAARSAGTCTIWGGDDPVMRSALFDPTGGGWHLDRARFESLLQAAAATAGVRLINARVCAAELERDGLWLIDATGRRAELARSLGARRHRADLLVARFAMVDRQPDDVDAQTRIEADSGGWWYSAPAADDRRVVAYLTDADLLPAQLRTATGYAATLSRTAHIRAGSGPGRCLDGPHGTSANSARLTPVAGPGWVAVGDAALAFDPLSSQGILNALVTGILAADAVDAALDGQLDPLSRYQDTVATVWSTYRSNRLDAYSQERRWPTAPFWRRRTVTRHVTATSA